MYGGDDKNLIVLKKLACIFAAEFKMRHKIQHPFVRKPVLHK
jgi:hypothetical protein